MIVGLTGGIATGKSTFSRALAELGLPVLDADVVAREVVASGTDGLRQVVTAFGEDILQADGTLDRAKLGGIIFADRSKRECLNAIVHPLVRMKTWGQAREYVKSNARKIIVLDIPLLFEGQMQQNADATVLVYAPPTLQLTRLMARNQLTAADARQRIEAQLAIEDKLQLADIVVHNVGDEATVPILAKRLFDVLQNLAAAGARNDGTFDRSVVQQMEIQG